MAGGKAASKSSSGDLPSGLLAGRMPDTGWIPNGLDLESKVDKFGILKTTVDIPDGALTDLMRFTHAQTKRAAIVRAVEDFNRRQRMAALTGYAGTFKQFMTQDDLEAMRAGGDRHGRR